MAEELSKECRYSRAHSHALLAYGTVNAAYTTAVAAVSPPHHHGNQDNGCASLQMCIFEAFGSQSLYE